MRIYLETNAIIKIISHKESLLTLENQNEDLTLESQSNGYKIYYKSKKPNGEKLDPKVQEIFSNSFKNMKFGDLFSGDIKNIFKTSAEKFATEMQEYSKTGNVEHYDPALITLQVSENDDLELDGNNLWISADEDLRLNSLEIQANKVDMKIQNFHFNEKSIIDMNILNFQSNVITTKSKLLIEGNKVKINFQRDTRAPLDIIYSGNKVMVDIDKNVNSTIGSISINCNKGEINSNLQSL